MIAVPCSPIVPETRMRSPGAQRGRRELRARVARPTPVVQTYIPSAVAALDDLRVAGDDLHVGRRGGRAAIASTSARSTSASQALLEHQREA